MRPTRRWCTSGRFFAYFGPRARVNARPRSKRSKLQHAQAASLRSPTSPGASSSRSTSRTGWFAFFPSDHMMRCKLNPALLQRSALEQILELYLVLVNRRRYTKKARGRPQGRLSHSCAPTPPPTGLAEAFGVRSHHRNHVACQKKLSLNPSPEFKRVMNCQRLPNRNGKRCGVNPRKHD
jgi:hypothetical protein